MRLIKALCAHKLIAIVIVGAAIRMWLVFGAQGISSDAYLYALVARRMAEHGLADGLKGHYVWPYAPVNTRLVVYPFLGSILIRLVGDAVLALRLVSVFSGIGLIALTFLTAKEIFRNEHAALLSAAVVGLEPGFTRASASVYREVTAAFFILLAFYLLLRCVRRERSWPAHAILAGLTLFVAFLTRPEAAILLVTFCAVTFLLAPGWKKRLLIPLIICLTFALLELPYSLWLKKTTGLTMFSQWQAHYMYDEEHAVERYLKLMKGP